MDIIGSLDRIAIDHPFLANIVITGGFNALWITLDKIILNRATTRSQIKINEFTAEKEVELKTKYLLL